MTQLNTYLTLDGNCLTVFEFYQSVFGGEFTAVQKFKDMPDDPKFTISKADKDKIMHISLPIGENTLMGSDTCDGMSKDFIQGNNFTLSINAESKNHADELFAKLSENGNASMPMADTFWGSYFGMLTDQFGIKWMISFAENLKA